MNYPNELMKQMQDRMIYCDYIVIEVDGVRYNVKPKHLQIKKNQHFDVWECDLEFLLWDKAQKVVNP